MKKSNKKPANKNITDDEKFERRREKDVVDSGRSSFSSGRDGAISEDIEDVKKRILHRMNDFHFESEVFDEHKKINHEDFIEENNINNSIATNFKNIDDNDLISKPENENEKLTKKTSDNVENKSSVMDSGELNKNYENDFGDNKDNELIVLDPDHPQMKRFQKSLKDLLEKQTAKLTLEIKELSEALKSKKVERENIGVQLYSVQQDLIKQQTLLQKHMEDLEKLNADRQKSEFDLSTLKVKFEDGLSYLTSGKQDISQLQLELEKWNLQYFYLENAGDNMAADVALMKRAALKSNVEINKAEQLKKKQDMFVDQLTKKVISQTEELEELRQQLANQIEDTGLAKEILNESMMEVIERDLGIVPSILIKVEKENLKRNDDC
ncbi:hypothetical protein HELRODRAFT_169363 [Helobdella robusta]|uniref:Uncharacterized protein n=1 Tax=Helobdella robusta TaxID=6412 RepID=T1F1U6_HELRO|nr:hypothetical protein HELRODRAFT_169363 [Helobdella robusta]ESO08505.1 hypothetical protein HELRODRAFT_169363 [Helobdella robusta]